MKREKTARVTVIVLTIISILLCISLVVTIILFEEYKRNNSIPVSAKPQLKSELPSSSVADAITTQSLKAYAQQYNVSVEFLQRFFNDVIVYKDSDQIVYAPIDEKLPKNPYDFKNLVYLDSEIQYQKNGVSTGIKGIDVSKYQGDINWNKVKADHVKFAIIRIGFRGYQNGKITIDESCKKNIEGAIAAGIKVGVYFFSQAITIEEVIQEADTVLEYIKDYKITYPVVFDAEEILEENARTNSLTTAQRTDITVAFCQKIKSAGYTPMIYANVKWFVAKLDMSRLTMYDKWFAQYFKTPFFPYDFQMWQYTGKGKVDGIKGDVDLNICFKDYSK
ncbi:glycoside hydrolase family 25 protein [Paludicola sp. MB14-C6]|uniref:glycoside hydrolase family 25 protein n=1 Tax=Paludihabitans sp. MB14-C6 TaxID=3070656 RepID=UPI0027DDEE73|nr:glycoside hydrolase family 25 protein [Paludicola sp. MB14-C6]WMJ23002.1 glycoside hydrolase family 25 protein [Paludicola sp. MB14-C6]